MKPGYSLIEVAVGLVLASMLATLLLRTFSHLQMSFKVTDSLMDNDTASIIVVNQMTRDISGAFVPQAARKQVAKPEQKEEKQDAQEKEKKPEKKEGEQAKQDTPVPASAPEKTPAPTVDMGTVFMVTHKNKNLELVSFVTCNPFLEYDQIKPRIARVMYRLVENPEQAGTFRLMRQESPILNLKEFEKANVKAYELTHGIKSCSCTCTLLEYPEKKNPKDEIVPTARTLADWVFDPQKAQEQKMVPLPYAVTFHCVFVDAQGQREWPVTFSVPIATFEPFGAQQRAAQQQPAAQKPEAEKPKDGKATPVKSGKSASATQQAGGTAPARPGQNSLLGVLGRGARGS